MSTKIYDAFKFDRQYSILEIGQLADKWRKDIAEIAEQKYAMLYVEELIYYYDLYKIRGVGYMKDQLDKIKKSKSSSNHTHDMRLLEDIINNGCKYLRIAVDSHLRECMKTDEFIKCEFRCKMTIHTIPRKTLCMVFAGNEFYNYMENRPELIDYHYQNQTDRPKSISKKAWDRRRHDWNKAIGPDYIPINHGMSMVLFDAESSNATCFITNKFLKNLKDHSELLPDVHARAKKIAETFENPNKCFKDMDIPEIMKYVRSDEYKSWMDNKIQEILPQLDTDMLTILSNIAK